MQRHTQGGPQIHGAVNLACNNTNKNGKHCYLTKNKCPLLSLCPSHSNVALTSDRLHGISFVSCWRFHQCQPVPGTMLSSFSNQTILSPFQDSRAFDPRTPRLWSLYVTGFGFGSIASGFILPLSPQFFFWEVQVVPSYMFQRRLTLILVTTLSYYTIPKNTSYHCNYICHFFFFFGLISI